MLAENLSTEQKEEQIAVIKNLQLSEIEKSINLYQETILNDINLFFKIIGQEIEFIFTISSWEGNTLHLEARSKVDALELNKAYSFNFNANNSLYLAAGEIIERIITEEEPTKDKNGNIIASTRPPKITYVATLTSELHKKQQRNFFRLETQLPVEIVLNTKDHFIDSEKPQLTTLSINTVDISAGGLKVSSAYMLSTLTIVRTNFTIDNVKYTLKGKILPFFDDLGEDGYVYRIAFIDIHPKLQERLLQDLLKLQRQLITIDKGLEKVPLKIPEERIYVKTPLIVAEEDKKYKKMEMKVPVKPPKKKKTMPPPSEKNSMEKKPHSVQRSLDLGNTRHLPKK